MEGRVVAWVASEEDLEIVLGSLETIPRARLVDRLVDEAALVVEATVASEVGRRARMVQLLDAWVWRCGESVVECEIVVGEERQRVGAAGTSSAAGSPARLAAINATPGAPKPPTTIDGLERILHDQPACAACGYPLHVATARLVTTAKLLRADVKLLRALGVRPASVAVCGVCHHHGVGSAVDAALRAHELGRPFARVVVDRTLDEIVEHLPRYAEYAERVRTDVERAMGGERAGMVSANRLERTRSFGILRERDGAGCVWCRRETEHPTYEHVVPRSRSGHDGLDNYAIACAPCNEARGDRSVTDWVADYRRRGLEPNLPALRARLAHLAAAYPLAATDLATLG